MVSTLRFTSFLAALATAALLTPSHALSADDPVNYDDPNMAVTNEFVGDAVATCSPDLSPKEVSRCLREKGLTAPQGVALVPSPHAPETR
ncbi:MAG: hypothetical protein V4760_02110 [Bdellovibrionota bacterium]